MDLVNGGQNSSAMDYSAHTAPPPSRAFGGLGAEGMRIYGGRPRCFLALVALNSCPRKCHDCGEGIGRVYGDS